MRFLIVLGAAFCLTGCDSHECANGQRPQLPEVNSERVVTYVSADGKFKYLLTEAQIKSLFQAVSRTPYVTAEARDPKIPDDGLSGYFKLKNGEEFGAWDNSLRWYCPDSNHRFLWWNGDDINQLINECDTRPLPKK